MTKKEREIYRRNYRALSSWHRHAERMAKILGCEPMQDAIEKAMADTVKTVRSIERSLDALESQISFMIPATDRFKVGQRVMFSDRAKRRGMADRTKNKVQRGIVRKVDSHSISVQLDGYKNAKSFSHSFFDRVKR